MTGLAIVQLVLAAVLIPVRLAHLPLFPAYVVDGRLVQSPVPIYVAAFALLALSWGYLLVGVLQAHPWLRLLGLAAFTWAIEMVHPSDPPLWVEIAWDAMLAVPWLVGAVSVMRDPRLMRRRGQTDGSPTDCHPLR